jgi:hypothetical protein
MNETLTKIQALIRDGNVRVSDHAYDELMEYGLVGNEVMAGVDDAIVVEDSPNYGKGP